jgi:hypothetical protein
MRTEKDFWIEMSIREIWTQAHFAEISFGNINTKGALGVDLVFSSIHSFLSHCAMISKMIKPEFKDKEIIGKILSIDINSIIHNKDPRNHLEHYDDRLQKWIKEKGVNACFGEHNIGPKSYFQKPGMVFESHYDPTNGIFTYVDKEVNLNKLFKETQLIKENARNWVRSVKSGEIEPPFNVE